ncbi:MAG: N-acetyl-gamma-glutamyl-phosphate reductase [Acidimicrobiia bacterium]|nr:N-acetyl-gamma-glutamyl-phosphate reductase [Actinomycetota bacterium]MBL6925316.1 N-acetyl-gamma-glutamyl-phosphate reductase [Acidimicrobiia bacterium]MBL6925846.1 N-acetyl-gamma-glutamyl-phosphate reductase [Acidimicrobiia bacterium]
MTNVGILGASGFTGAELLRICAAHPTFDVVVATGDTQAGTAVADLYPSLAAEYPDLTYAEADPSAFDGCDVVFLCLPHGASQTLVPELLGRVGHVVDLGADFRLTDASLYPTWYGEAHAAPKLLAEAAYGLPELFRAGLPGARLVAVPGCYPTAAALALAPFLRAGVIEPGGIVVDAASGVSGAGRGPKPGTTFCAVDEDYSAYGLTGGTTDDPAGHRHTPEIEQAISTAADGSTLGAAADVSVLFTPHLAPMNRGILATCYARPTSDMDSAGALSLLADAYAGESFIVVSERSPSTKATSGSNTAHLTARVDPRTGLLVVVCAIDNLVKGASGQAVQCANIASGIDEATGLPTVGMYP